MRWLFGMHARELIQLAATVAAHAPLLIHSKQPFPEGAIERYWTASKCRQEGWSGALKEFTRGKQDLSLSPEEVGHLIPPILEEVLTAEVLSRVWAAVCSLADTRRGRDETFPIAQNILAGHLEARHRVLNLMVYGYGLRVEEAVALNRMRIRNERWNDTLLSLLGPAAGKAEWAFQPRRVRSLAMALRQQEFAGGTNLAKSLLLATLAAAYQRPPTTAAPHAELNRRIACSVVACFPPHVFDATGLPTSVQQLWLLQSTSDTQGRLDVAQPCEPVSSDDYNAFPAPPGNGDQHRRFDLR